VRRLTRRAVTTTGAALAGAGRLEAAGRINFDFTRPRDNLVAWMKLHTRLDDGGVHYWYRARLDVARPGQAIATLCGYDTMYRLNVRRTGADVYEVTRWEVSFYTDARTNRVIDTLDNPFNGRTVAPFHIKEGPVTTIYSTNRPRLVGSDAIGTGERPFLLDWTVVGDDVWTSNEVFVRYRNRLQPGEWPLESSGEMLTFSNISTVRGLISELTDPARATVPCRYSYQATSVWLPWMLMGQVPGNLIWRAQAAKLDDPATIPTDSLATFKRLHPEIFNDVPWTENRSLYGDFAKVRRPAAP
jgi:hypothetical protein